MADGWFVFVVVACVVLCSGCVLALALLRAAWARQERESLTSSDLRALEESVVMLIEQLHAEVDTGLAEIHARSEALQGLVHEADDRLAALRDLPTEALVRAQESPAAGEPGIRRIADLASSGLSCSEIARTTGVGLAEVKLMLRLAGCAAE